LDARFLEQLAMLLLSHPLATLLDDRAHVSPFEDRPVEPSDPFLVSQDRLPLGFDQPRMPA
jgi:hypothetical protein